MANSNPFRTDGLRRDVRMREIAEALGVTTQAVYSWKERLPLLRAYQLKERKPEWFKREKAAA